MASKVYIGDIGTIVKLNYGTDCSAGTTFKIRYEKPDGTSDYWTGAYEEETVGNNTYYWVKYTVTTGDLDTTGKWVLQSYLESTSWTGHGESVDLIIYPLGE